MEVIKITKNQTVVENSNISTIKNVCAYARVSSEFDNQLHSLDNQIKHYENKIKNNKDWNFVGIYYDEGISGRSTKNRTQFLKMMLDADEGKIDIILTKSISRFARNTVDTLKYVRYLRDRNVAVIFEEEGINTLNETSELILTILGSIAQQESENLGSHVKLAYTAKMRSGEVRKSNAAFGYRYDEDKKMLVVDKEEAEVVRLIYNKYIELKGINILANYLHELGIKTKNGKEFWATSQLKRLMKNPIYVGDVLYRKHVKVGGQQIENNGIEDQIIARNRHEAIIDRETFDLCNKMLMINANKQIKNNPPVRRPYMKCGTCGSSYYLSHQKGSYKCLTTCKKIHTVKCNVSYSYPQNIVYEILDEAIRLINKYKNTDIRGIIYAKKIIALHKDEDNQNEFYKQLFREVLMGEDGIQTRIGIIFKSNNLIDVNINKTNFKTLKKLKLFDFKYTKPFIRKDFDTITRKYNYQAIDSIDVNVYMEI